VSAISKGRETTKGVQFKKGRKERGKLTSSSESCPKRGIAVWLTSIISTFKSGRRKGKKVNRSVIHQASL